MNELDINSSSRSEMNISKCKIAVPDPYQSISCRSSPYIIMTEIVAASDKTKKTKKSTIAVVFPRFLISNISWTH